MSLITLYGYIENPIEYEAFYILRESKESDTLYKYEGRIGYGEHGGDSPIEPGFPTSYTPSDMRTLSFTYDTEKSLVKVTTQWRMLTHASEAALLKTRRNNVTMEHPDNDADADTYPYFIYPRSKDGIAVARVFDKIFEGKDITVFLPTKYRY